MKQKMIEDLDCQEQEILTTLKKYCDELSQHNQGGNDPESVFLKHLKSEYLEYQHNRKTRRGEPDAEVGNSDEQGNNNGVNPVGTEQRGNNNGVNPALAEQQGNNNGVNPASAEQDNSNGVNPASAEQQGNNNRPNRGAEGGNNGILSCIRNCFCRQCPTGCSCNCSLTETDRKRLIDDNNPVAIEMGTRS